MRISQISKQSQPDPKYYSMEAISTLQSNYGDYGLLNEAKISERKWIPIQELTESKIGQDVLVRARVHAIRPTKKVLFLILRQREVHIQAVAFTSKESEQMIKWANAISKESIVDIYGVVSKPDREILACSQKVELQIKKIYVVSRSESVLTFQIEDASRKYNLEEEELENFTSPKQASEEKITEEAKNQQKVIVGLKNRLDNRIIDLRTKTNQAIFRLESGVCRLFREFMFSKQFLEVQLPKLISGASEGGAEVFKLNYFGQEACLAQSPQNYKQMCVMGDFERVFTVGPVFRAENSLGPRHMTEFTGLDAEMSIKESYHEIMDVVGELFTFLFEEVEKRFAQELEAIKEQYPFDLFKMKKPLVKLTFQEGVELLKEDGVIIDPLKDLDTPTEKKLGEIIKKKYETDFYILHRYPKSVRPFYTMVASDDERYTNSFDVFMRGQEIISGGQRFHETTAFVESAKAHEINLDTIASYIDSFRYGAYPHGGFGVGLERVVILYCALGNIRRTSLFPRDPKRITP